MKPRSMQIISLLAEDKPMTSAVLADALEVSPRTIKREMPAVAAELPRYGAELCSGNAGYSIAVADRTSFSALVSSFSRTSTNDEQELCQVLCALFTHDYVTRDDLAELLFMSRTSTGRPVKAARALMEERGLILSSRPHHGYYVIGNEAAVRALAVEKVLSQDSKYWASFLPRSKDVRRELPMVLEQVGVGRHDPRVRDVAHHLIVTGKRCSMGCSLGSASVAAPLPPEVNQVAAFLEDAYGTKLETGDRLAIARLLGLSPEVRDNITPADFEGVVEEAVAKIKALYGRDLSDDDRLRRGLVAHLWSTCGLMQSDAIVTSPLLPQVKSLYSEAYDYAVVCGGALAPLGISPSEDNMGYIAMHFAAAIERQDSRERYQVVVVCESGYGTSELLRTRIEGRFSGLVVSQVLVERQLATANLGGVALIVSTIPLSYAGDVPTIQVTPFLNDDDVAKISDFLSYLKDTKRIRRLFSEELFFPGLSAVDKDDALDQISRTLMGIGALDEEGKVAMYRREEASSTEINPGVAMAHCLLGPGLPTTYAIFTLEHPINWGYEDVSLVFALLISPSEGIDRRLFPVVYRYTKGRADIADLAAEKRFPQFMDRFFVSSALEGQA